MSTAQILVALDGSAFAERALEPAVELAIARAAGIRLYAAVVERKAGEVVSDFDDRTYEPIEEGPARRLEASQAYLDRVVERLQARGVVVVSHTSVENDAADGIVREAIEHDVETIVMTSHGRSGIGRWLMGSVAERVLRATPVPVLIVPARGS